MTIKLALEEYASLIGYGDEMAEVMALVRKVA